jgi:uncharacterized membrane protein YfcA
VVLILLTLLALVAGMVQGATGFGFGLLFTPLATLGLPPKPAIAAALLIGAISAVAVLTPLWRSVPLRRCLPLLIGGVLGTLAGARLVVLLDVRTARIIVAIVAAASAVAFWRLRPRPARDERFVFAAAGTLGGVLNAATSMGGPPPALAIAGQRWPPAAARGAICVFNLMSYVLALVFAVAFNGLHGLRWDVVLACALAGLLGTVAGVRVGGRLDTAAFERVVVATIVLAATVAIIAAIAPS